MSEELQKIVDEYREKEIHISDEEAEQILWLCNRKMDICKIENREEYLPLNNKCHCGSYAAGMQKQQYRILPGAQKQCNRTAEKSRKARKDFCKNRGRLQFTRESVLHPGWL